MQNFMTVLLLMASVAIIIAVLLMEPKSQGMGTISGSDTNVFGKSGFKTKDALYNKVTVVASIVFLVSAIIVAAL